MPRALSEEQNLKGYTQSVSPFSLSLAGCVTKGKSVLTLSELPQL